MTARRVLAATGLVDELPDIERLAEHWGGDVIHCPFCHGFEVRDRRIVQVVTHPVGLRPASLFRQLTDRFTMVLHEGVDAADPELDSLRTAGVRVVDARVRRIVTGDDGHVAAVELADGSRIDADAIAVGPRSRVRAEPFASLGLKPAEHPIGLGDFIETDATGATSIDGLYAAGISQRALDQVSALADEHDLSIECVHADASALDPFEPGAFDLVSAGHDLAPLFDQGEQQEQGLFIDPRSFVGPDAIAGVLAQSPEWQIEVHEKRPVSAGSHRGPSRNPTSRRGPAGPN